MFPNFNPSAKLEASPSPTRSRRRKTGPRRSAKGSSPYTTTSLVKSPTKGELHEELESKAAQLEHRDSEKTITPSSFKYMGPATAVRDANLNIDDIIVEDSDDSRRHSRNLNDVCFGCDGSCGDNTCGSSKRSSHISADVESNGAETPVSPSDALKQVCRDLEEKYGGHGGEPDIEEDSKNSNVQKTVEPEKGDSDNGNSQSESPVKKVTRSPKSRSPKTSSRQQNKKFKRLRSMGEGEESPSKKGHMKKGSVESLDEKPDQVSKGASFAFWLATIFFFTSVLL